MAPEQLEGVPADTRTDVFAFGLILYEMLTGCRAFDGKTPASIIAAVLSSEPKPVAALSRRCHQLSTMSSADALPRTPKLAGRRCKMSYLS